MAFNTHTKLAIRAVVVALICIGITRFFAIDRSYWTFLTAFLLITYSFGDGIYRSLLRFILTIAGCLIGWVIYLPAANNLPVLMLLCLLYLFLMLYWFNSNLIGRNLVTGMLVVNGFGILNGGWTFSLLAARIEDTLIGAAIAIVVNGLVFPEFAKTDVKKIFRELRAKLLAVHQEIKTGITREECLKAQKDLQALETERLKLSESYQQARYELLFRKRRNLYKNMLLETDIVFSYLNALSDLKLASFTKQHSLKQELIQSGEAYYNTRLANELSKLTAI